MGRLSFLLLAALSGTAPAAAQTTPGGYLLPFEEGYAARVLQGNNGPYGHVGHAAFAFDFQAPIGTTVVAARGGVVIYTVARFVDGNRTAGDENVIVVRHPDGTFGRYYHLTHDGATVAVGDTVQAGQPIARSGDTGASAGPHLHFDVTEGCFEWRCPTVPVRFEDAPENPLVAGRTYTAGPEHARASSDACSPAALAGTVGYLASDALLGRAPGTRGDTAAAGFVASYLLWSGLEGADGGSGNLAPYLQSVPIRRSEVVEFALDVHGEPVHTDPSAVVSEQNQATVTGEAHVLDLGYGVDSPEVGYSDYGDQDVRGGIVLVRDGVNDEFRKGLPFAGHPFQERIAHKTAAARAHGAHGLVLITGRDISSAMPRAVGPDRGERRLDFVWVVGAGTPEAERLQALATSGESLEYPLEQNVERTATWNVIGRVPGTSDQAPIWVTAHRDGLGVGPANEAGDSIYNGARDNAEGVAALLCLAHRMAESAPPTRTTLFIATGAEETGHIGMARALELAELSGRLPSAVLNIDGLNAITPTEDMVAYGIEGTDGSWNEAAITQHVSALARLLEGLSSGGLAMRVTEARPYAPVRAYWRSWIP